MDNERHTKGFIYYKRYDGCVVYSECLHLVTRSSSPMLKMINYTKPKLLLVLAELGDHDEDMHNPALISEFRFVPNQNEEFEIDVLEAYKKNK